MGVETGIQWTDHTFNPWWGCTRVSPGCENCYAETWAKRFDVQWGPSVSRRFFGDKKWNEPVRWNRAAEKAGRRARVFCASMADVFEDRRDLDGQRELLFDLIEATPFLDWQLLTKRPENMVPMAPIRWADSWPANVWAGCTVEDQRRAEERIPSLLAVPARVRFLSVEPQLGPVDLARVKDDEIGASWNVLTSGIGWVIVGGESGRGARDFDVKWARTIVQQCKAAGVPVFVKQMGAAPIAGTPLVRIRLDDKKGGNWDEWPDRTIAVREFPL